MPRQPGLIQTRWAMNYLAGPLTRTQIPLLNQLAGAALTPDIPAAAASTGVASTPAQTAYQQPLAAAAPVDTRPVGAARPARPQRPLESSTTRPTLPAGVREYFLPNNLTFTQAFKAAGQAYPQEAFSQGLVYRPVILGQVSVRFLNRKYNLDFDWRNTALVANPDRRGVVRWENYTAPAVDPDALDETP